MSSRPKRPLGKWVLGVLISSAALFGVLNSAFLGFCLGVFVESTRRDAAELNTPIGEASYQTTLLHTDRPRFSQFDTRARR